MSTMKRSIGKMIGIAVLVAVAFVVFFTVGGLVVQGLWNWLLPELFGWPVVSFWQALGLLVLSRILFGGFGMGGGPGRGRKGKRGPHWDLSVEERERLKQQIAKDEGETM